MSEQVKLAERLTTELCDFTSIDTSSEVLERLEVLLADFIICVASANRLNKNASLLKNDGVIGSAARFASQSAYEDKDDLDWSAVNHPGSVVFASSFAMALTYPDLRENFLRSILAGMRSSASVAHFFGGGHRKRWHITATAGTFGAVSAASAALNLDLSQAQRALHLAGTNMGGIGQVSRELQGTPRFNRSAAAALGVTATLAAFENIPAISNLWSGDRGLLEVFDLEGALTHGELIKDGVSTVRVRTFPATGFIHSALLGVAQLAAAHSAPLKELIVTVNSGVFPILSDPAKERWWNLQWNCAAAWASKDPMNLTPAPEVEKLVTVAGGNIPLGSAQISGQTENESFDLLVEHAPGLNLFEGQEIAWRNQKWSSMVGDDFSRITQLASELVRGTANDSTWREINRHLRGE
mgnify:FL=1